MVERELKYSKTNDRKIVVLRGVAGSGKSSFLRDRQLSDYALSMDDIRNMISSPLHVTDNYKVIDNSKNRKVFNLFMELLETRLSNGVFTVIDNTNVSTNSIAVIEGLANRYGYNMTVINFEEDYEVLVKRNEKRYGTTKHFISEISLRNMYDTFNQNNDRVKRKYNVISSKDEEGINKLLNNKYANLNKYSKVKVIGDIHGSYNVLIEAIPEIEEDVFYIFLGDYIDRGTKNHEVLNYLLKIYKKDNVVLLEGNHEIYLRAFTNSVELGYGKEFKNYTKKELIDKKTDLKAVRKMMKSIKTMFNFEFNGKCYVCSHGGVLPTNYNLLHHDEKIRGVGGYDFNIDRKWDELSEGEVQFHGHRNKLKVKPHAYKTSYNLEGGVDSGGYLRVATIEGTEVKVKEYLNKDVREDKMREEIAKVEDMLDYAYNTEGIRVKDIEYQDIVGINFGHKFFFKGEWDADSVKARGLFVDLEEKKVVSRGYEKFFNIGEKMTLEEIADSYLYPVVGYKKENGYVGLVSYSHREEGIMFSTKSVMINSTDDLKVPSEFAKELRRIFYNIFNSNQIEYIEDYLRMTNTTLVFEAISMKDKHITLEDKDELVLLDSIKNEIDFNKKSYKRLNELVNNINELNDNEYELRLKEKALLFKNKESFINYIQHQNNFNIKHEGFVFEDSVGNMVKYKSEYYNFWKYFRSTINYAMKIDTYEGVVKSVKDRLSNYKNKKNLNEDAEQYIDNVYDNIEEYIMLVNTDFKYENLLGHKEIDIPKTAQYFEGR